MKQLEFNWDLPEQFQTVDLNTVTNLAEIRDWLDYLENVQRAPRKSGWLW